MFQGSHYYFLFYLAKKGLSQIIKIFKKLIAPLVSLICLFQEIVLSIYNFLNQNICITTLQRISKTCC